MTAFDQSSNRRTRWFARGVALSALTMCLVWRGDAAAAGLTLVSMQIDGSTGKMPNTCTNGSNCTGDWTPVLNNAYQTSNDGQGYQIACNLSTDRDCPVGGGFGNDLLGFAWSYDANFVYLFIERWGSSSNGV